GYTSGFVEKLTAKGDHACLVDELSAHFHALDDHCLTASVLERFGELRVEINEVVSKINNARAIGQQAGWLSLNFVQRNKRGAAGLAHFQIVDAFLSDLIVVDDYMAESRSDRYLECGDILIFHMSKLANGAMHASDAGLQDRFHGPSVSAFTGDFTLCLERD